MSDSQEDDLHNFSASPRHRLPTLNGTQALQAVIESRRPISTGMAALDNMLSDHDENHGTLIEGGIARGTLTEIYGPPGVGKTTFAIQLAASVLKDEGDAKVIWIDTCADVSVDRLSDFINNQPNDHEAEGAFGENGPSMSKCDSVCRYRDLDVMDNMHHLHISSLPHLLALLLHPVEDFPPKDTSLLILDNLSSIATTSLPQRKYEPMQDFIAIPSSTANHSDAITPGRLDPANIFSKSLSARRMAMIASISAGLQRLAASHNIAVVVLNKTATSSSQRTGNRTILRSVMGYQQWNENVMTRIVLYRDHWPQTDWTSLSENDVKKRRRLRSLPLRVAEIERLGGVDVSADGIKFVILKHSLHAIDPPESNPVPIKISAAESPIPDNIDDDGNEDFQNLDIADIDEDQIPAAIEATAALVSQHSRKRKTMEVEDSEEDGEEIEPSQARLPPMPKARGGFLPSSQLMQDDTSDVESPLTNRPFRNAKDIGLPSGDSDMLLQ